jgi:uncharacterized protein Usg
LDSGDGMSHPDQSRGPKVGRRKFNGVLTYVWQDYDLAPKFPVLIGFVEFWKAKLEGPLHSIQFTHRKLIAPNEWRKVDGELVLH